MLNNLIYRAVFEIIRKNYQRTVLLVWTFISPWRQQRKTYKQHRKKEQKVTHNIKCKKYTEKTRLEKLIKNIKEKKN